MLKYIAAALLFLLALSFPTGAWADSLVVTADVPANITHFQLQPTSSYNTPIPANREVTYTITYGWLPATATDIMVIQATWSLGNFPDGQKPVLEYIDQSASKALNQFSAQYDPVNRTLTWNVTPMPSGKDRQVTFRLRTLNVASGQAVIPFQVSFRLIGPGYTMPWQNLDQQYQQIIPGTPTPTPTKSTVGNHKPTPTPSAPPLINQIIDKTTDTVVKLAQDHPASIGLSLLLISLISLLINILFSLGSLLSLISLSQLVPLLGLWLWGKKRQPWGVVYDAKTKLPLDPVLLTLANAQGQSSQAISDIYGRYQFIVSPGTYTLTAQKTHYRFPSTQLDVEHGDPVYDDIYFGQPIVIEDSGSFSLNIPMDNMDPDWNQQAKQEVLSSWHTRLRRLSWFFYGLGLAWSILVISLQPHLTNLLLAGLYLVVGWLLLRGGRRRAWGVIYNKHQQPVSNAVISLINIDSPLVKYPPVVTDGSGRYAFLTSKGNYRVDVALRSQSGQPWPILSTPTIKQNKSEGYIAQDIHLGG